MDIKIFDLGETQTYMDIGPHDEALNISGFRNLVIETIMPGGFYQATFEVTARANRPYPVHSYLPARITEGASTVFDGYVAPKFPKKSWLGEQQSLKFALYGYSAHFAELEIYGPYIDAGVKNSTFVTDWIHGGVTADDYNKGDPYLRCSIGDVATTDAARTSPIAWADPTQSYTWRTVLDDLSKDSNWEWGIYEGKLLFFRPRHTTVDYYVYMSDSSGELEDAYGNIVDWITGAYRPAFGSDASRTWYPDAGFDPSTNRLGVRRFTQGTGNFGIDQANTVLQTEYGYYSQPHLTGPLSVRRIYDKDGIEIPRWRARAGGTCALKGYEPWGPVIDQFFVQRTSYNHNTTFVQLDREEQSATVEQLLSKAGGR